MKLNCNRIDFTYTPGEEIFNFPEESGLPFLFDVEEELTADPAAMDVVGEMLDEAEKLAEKAKAAIKAALADEDSRYHSVVTFFMEFHRDDVGPDIAAELFPGTDPSKLSFAEMVDFLKLKRFGSLVDDEMDQQVFSSGSAVGWMERRISRPSSWICPSTRKSPTSWWWSILI